jgi:hypothetical protein
MIMEMYERIVLKAVIKGLAVEGQRTRKFINRTSKDVRYGHWSLKRKIGEQTRMYLLAYAFLEGRSYRSVEPYTELHEISGVLSRMSETLQTFVNRFSSWEKGNKNVWIKGKGYVRQYDLDEVTFWLNHPKADPLPPPVKRPYDPSRIARIKEEK